MHWAGLSTANRAYRKRHLCVFMNNFIFRCFHSLTRAFKKNTYMACVGKKSSQCIQVRQGANLKESYYVSLKRILNNSTCPCSLKDTAVSNALEKHAGWVQTFTFIYMHLADAFFWKATHNKGDIRFSSDVYVTYEAEERSQMEYPEIIHWCFRDTQTTWISLFTSPEKALFSQLVPICFQLLL